MLFPNLRDIGRMCRLTRDPSTLLPNARRLWAIKHVRRFSKGLVTLARQAQGLLPNTINAQAAPMA
jgi:hypothetical protein